MPNAENLLTPSARENQVAAYKRHLTFSQTYRNYLRRPESEWPSSEELEAKPYIHRLAVESLRRCLDPDAKTASAELKLVMERTEGKAREQRDGKTTAKELMDSPFAQAIRNLQVKPRQVMIEPGPDKEDPESGAVYETVEFGDPRWAEAKE